MVRELNLASKLAKQSFKFDMMNIETMGLISGVFSELFRVPCEPVPLTKLLLHADTIIRSKPNGRDSFGGIEGVKSLISAASPPIGAKPTIKASDLTQSSPSFDHILWKLGNSSSYGLDLMEVISCLEELVVRVSEALIQNLLKEEEFQSLVTSLKDSLILTSSQTSSTGITVTEEDIYLLHQKIALKFKTLLFVLSNQDKNLRNPVHYLAISGASQVISNLTAHLNWAFFTFFDLEQRLNEFMLRNKGELQLPPSSPPTFQFPLSSFVSHLRSILSTRDKRGHTPVDYAAIRFGKDSPFFRTAMKELYQLIGSTEEKGGEEEEFGEAREGESSDSGGNEHSPSLYSLAMLKSPRLSQGGYSVNPLSVDPPLPPLPLLQPTLLQQQLQQPQMIPETEERKRSILLEYDTPSAGGGWDDSRLSPHLAGPGGAGETEESVQHCDIMEVWDGLPSEQEFYEKYLKMGQPVIFRGAAGKEGVLRTAFEKGRFVERYGGFVMPVSDIPYAGTFGIPSSLIRVKEMSNLTPPPHYLYSTQSTPSSSTPSTGALEKEINHSMNNHNNNHSMAPPPALLDSIGAVPYSFTTATPEWRERLQQDAPIPPCLRLSVEEGKVIEGSDEKRLDKG